MKWGTTSSTTKLVPTDAPLHLLPDYEQAALDQLRDRTENVVEELSKTLPECDSWSRLSSHSHSQLRDEILLRFLRYNVLNVDKSAVQMEGALKWRRQSMVATLSEDVMKGLQVGIPIAQVTDCNEQGEALYICVSSAYAKAQVDHEKQTTATGKMFDFIMYDLNGPQVKHGFIIVDFTDVGLSNIDLIAVKNGIVVFLNYYPDVFRKIIFFNYPRIVYGLWKAIAPLLDSRTKSRIVWVAGPAELRQILFKSFALEIVPDWLGGGKACSLVTLLNGINLEASELRRRFLDQKQ